MSARPEQRAREVRARAQLRAWEYRQRHTARGVWFRLRRVLVDAAEAWAIPASAANRLMAEGLVPEPVGSELEPVKRIIFAPADRVRQIAGARPIVVGLGADFLLAADVALVPRDRSPSAEKRAEQDA